MALPNFIVVGAMKCGTSTLQRQLDLQEDVFMSTPKEPNYFSNDEIFANGQDWYEGLFADGAETPYRGEASTHYTKLPTYPETATRMADLLSDLKLIYVIRDPVARAVSHYMHEWTERRVGADAEAAFRNHGEFIEYGCYGMQIAPYIERYGKNRILLSSLESLAAEPDAELARIAAFLDLNENAHWHHEVRPQNVSKDRIRRIPLQSILIESPLARKMRHVLVPAGLRRMIRRQRQLRHRPTVPEDLKRQIERRFLEDRKTLAQFFPDHPALDLCYPFAAK